MSPRRRRFVALAGAAALALIGCRAVDKVVQGTANVARDAGIIRKEDAESIKRTSAAFRKSAEEFTDSEEHYIGRSVAAEVFARYEKPSTDAALMA